MHAIVVHGGAGAIMHKKLTPVREAAYLDALANAVRAGEGVIGKWQ